MTKVSVIVPSYNSGSGILRLYRALNNIMPLYDNYEIIFIDDGSKDNTAQIITGIREMDPHIRMVQLGKHGGQYEALFAGYKYSNGEIVVSLDDDAFEEINYIPKFIEKINEGYDAVFGWREKNGVPLFRKGGSFLFNLIISLLIRKRIHDIGSSLKVKNRRMVEKIVSLGDLTYIPKYYRYYRITELKLPHKYSKGRMSRYNFIKLIKAALSIFKNNIF